MFLDVVFESLRFLGRDDLDACQLASKSFRNIVEGSTVLALRTITSVNLSYVFRRPYLGICRLTNGVVRFVEPWQGATQAGDVNSLEHLRNAYIEKMNLHSEAERCVPLLSGASDALNFKVARLHYGENLQETETLQRSVDWIVHDLRVTDYELALWAQDDVDNASALLPTTIMHDSVRSTAEFLCAKIYTRSPTPAVFGLLFDAPNLAAVLQFGHRRDSATEFVDAFIRRFISENDVSRVARSVSIEQSFKKGEPHNFLPKVCGAPQQQDVDVPKTRCLDERLSARRCDVQKCDLYVFENSASGTELRLYATTVHVVDDGGFYDFSLMTLTTV